jgi:hypothetical protein
MSDFIRVLTNKNLKFWVYQQVQLWWKECSVESRRKVTVNDSDYSFE